MVLLKSIGKFSFSCSFSFTKQKGLLQVFLHFWCYCEIDALALCSLCFTAVNQRFSLSVG